MLIFKGDFNKSSSSLGYQGHRSRRGTRHCVCCFANAVVVVVSIHVGVCCTASVSEMSQHVHYFIRAHFFIDSETMSPNDVGDPPIFPLVSLLPRLLLQGFERIIDHHVISHILWLMIWWSVTVNESIKVGNGSSIIRSVLLFVHHFGLHFPSSCWTLCLVLISRCYHGNTLN